MFADIYVLPPNSLGELVNVFGEFDVNFLPIIAEIETGYTSPKIGYKMSYYDGDSWSRVTKKVQVNDGFCVRVDKL